MLGMIETLSFYMTIEKKEKPQMIETTWLGPYNVEKLNTNGLGRLKTLQGQVFEKVVNGEIHKCYYN